MDEINNQRCPFCGKKSLTLREELVKLPEAEFFKFSMSCDECKTHKEDIEAGVSHPNNIVFEVTDLKDLEVTVAKSSEATLKIPHLYTYKPGEMSEGFILSVEQLFQKIKTVLQSEYQSELDDSVKKKLKNSIKKIGKILAGHEKTKIILKDPSGNSAIVT